MEVSSTPLRCLVGGRAVGAGAGAGARAAGAAAVEAGGAKGDTVVGAADVVGDANVCAVGAVVATGGLHMSTFFLTTQRPKISRAQVWVFTPCILACRGDNTPCTQECTQKRRGLHGLLIALSSSS